MKRFKRSISLVLICVLALSMLVLAPAQAAAADSTAPKSGSILKCGGYLFTAVYEYDRQAYCLYRSTTTCTKAKLISTKLVNDTIFRYKSRIFYREDGVIKSYNTKTLKKSTFVMTKYDPVDICKKGIIAEYDNYVYLVGFDSTIKIVSSAQSYYIACNSDNILFLTRISHTDDKSDRYYVMRYSLADKKASASGEEVSIPAGYGSSYLPGFHGLAVGGRVVFTGGNYQGTGMDYTGNLYSMTTSGTEVRKLAENVANYVTLGKNCVYSYENKLTNVNKNVYKVGTNGLISKTEKCDTVYTTENGGLLGSRTDADHNYTLRVAASASLAMTNLIYSNKTIRKTDPSDTSSRMAVLGTDGDYALVTCTPNTSVNGMGWRNRNLRTYVYVVNVNTLKAYNLKKNCNSKSTALYKQIIENAKLTSAKYSYNSAKMGCYFKDFDGNGCKELVLAYSTTKGNNSYPEYVMSMYTVKNGIAVPLIFEKNLYNEVGGPSGYVGLVKKGKSYYAMGWGESGTTGAAGDSLRSGTYTLYKVKDGKAKIAHKAEYKISFDSTTNPVKVKSSTIKINGKSKTHLTFISWLTSIKTVNGSKKFNTYNYIFTPKLTSFETMLSKL